MLTKYSVAASLAVLTAVGSTVWAAQQPNSSNEYPQNVGNGSAASGAQAGTANEQPAGNLASAMANFMVRTGLVVGPDAQGRLVVEHIRPESDAARLGIKTGDVLTSLNGTETNTMRALQNYLTAHSNQSAFSIGMGRGKRNFTQPMGRQMSLMGMTIFPDSADRPTVYSVQPGSAAAKAGVKAGDVMTSVGHQTTDTMTKFMNMSIPLIRALDPGEGVPFGFARNGKQMKLAIARPKDSDLQPLSPAEQHVLDRQGGVLSTATQEPEQPRQNNTTQRLTRRKNNRRQPQNGAAMAGQTGLGTAAQNPNQQGQNEINGGGFGLGLDGLGGGSTAAPSTGTGTTGVGSNGNVNSVVAVLYGTAQNQNQNTNQGNSTSGQTGANNRSGNNNSSNSGQVGYVTIQSTVPLSQSANNANGMTNGTTGTTATGTTATGTTATGTTPTGTTPTGTTATGTTATGTTATGTTATGTTATGTTAIGTTPTGTTAIGTTANPTIGLGNSGFGTGSNTTTVNPPLGTPGGANPVTGNTGTPQGVNPQTGNTGAGNNSNSNNGNYPSTVSAQVTGLPPGQYALVVSQYGSCGDAAAVTTGPVAANLGTLQVSTNGQGILRNVSVAYPPTAFIGRVVAVVPPTAPGTGTAAIAPRSPTTATSSNTNPNTVWACGVFRNSNRRQPFTGGIGNGLGGNGSGTGNGTPPVNGTPPTNGTGGGASVENPLNGGAGAVGGGSAPAAGGARR